PRHHSQRIRYFTARISARATDPQGPARQDAYLRALETFPAITAHFGQFITKPTRMPLARPHAGGPRTVEVMKTEEKGSDVKLASYLLADAFRGEAEGFVVVSNDSELKEPARIVVPELGLPVGIINPHQPSNRSHT